jgi:tail tube protein gp19
MTSEGDERPVVEGPEGSAPTRRGFLAGAAGLTGVALAVGSWKPVFAMAEAPAGPAAATIIHTTVKVGAIGLTLGESPAGFLSSAQGGNAFADVVNEKLGNDVFVHKHIGGVKYEDIAISAGTGMDKDFYNWVSTSVAGNGRAMSGSIVGADENLKIFTKTDFFNALITEVGMPALDAASKDAAKMTIKFSPEFTRHALANGSLSNPSPKTIFQSKWLTSNFKFTLTGVDTTRVSKIDALTVKMDFGTPAADSDVGSQLLEVEVPNLKITVAESGTLGFSKWVTDFIVKGNNSTDFEKEGRLSYLSSDLKTELFRLDFFGLGIFALDPDPLTTASTGVRHVNAQLYCDKALFSAGPITTT